MLFCFLLFFLFLLLLFFLAFLFIFFEHTAGKVTFNLRAVLRQCSAERIYRVKFLQLTLQKMLQGKLASLLFPKHYRHTISPC